MPSNVLALGASRGCAFYAVIELLKTAQDNVILLLRNPDTLVSNPAWTALTDEQRGRAKLIQGNAHHVDDITKALDAADGQVDKVIFSIGAKPTIKWSLKFGADQPNVCERGMRALLAALAPRQDKPHVVLVSTMGVGDTFRELPLLLKPLYAMIEEAHADKEAAETLLWSAVGKSHPFPNLRIEDGPKGGISSFTVVRSGLLTDGAGKPRDQLRAGSSVKGAYTVSRRSIGTFIVSDALVSDKWIDTWVVVAN